MTLKTDSSTENRKKDPACPHWVPVLLTPERHSRAEKKPSNYPHVLYDLARSAYFVLHRGLMMPA